MLVLSRWWSISHTFAVSTIDVMSVMGNVLPWMSDALITWFQPNYYSIFCTHVHLISSISYVVDYFIIVGSISRWPRQQWQDSTDAGWKEETSSATHVSRQQGRTYPFVWLEVRVDMNWIVIDDWYSISCTERGSLVLRDVQDTPFSSLSYSFCYTDTPCTSGRYWVKSMF